MRGRGGRCRINGTEGEAAAAWGGTGMVLEIGGTAKTFNEGQAKFELYSSGPRVTLISSLTWILQVSK